MTPARILTTDEDIDRALAAAALLPEPVRALTARYDPTLDLVILTLDNGHRLVIPREEMQGLEAATPEQLAHIEIFSGLDIAWPSLDVDHYLPYLMEGRYATEKWIAARTWPTPQPLTQPLTQEPLAA